MYYVHDTHGTMGWDGFCKKRYFYYERRRHGADTIHSASILHTRHIQTRPLISRGEIRTMLLRVIFSCLLLYFPSTSISNPFEELLLLKREYAIKAVSPLYRLNFLVNTISSFERVVSDVNSYFDFSSLESLVLCIDLGGSDFTSCRPVDKTIMQYDIINDYISGLTTIKFYLFAPVDSREALFYPQNLDEKTGQPYLFHLKEFEGIDFLSLGNAAIEIPLVLQNDATRNIRKYLESLQLQRDMPGNGQEASTFGIQTLTSLYLEDSNETLIEMYRDFTLSLGARDLRMILSKNHLLKCHESLGLHIVCCDMSDQGQLNSCIPSTTDVLILFMGKQKLTNTQSQLIQLLGSIVRGSILVISDQPETKVISQLPNTIRLAEHPSNGDQPANLLQPIDSNALGLNRSSLHFFDTILYANVSNLIISSVSSTNMEKISSVFKKQTSSHQRVSSRLTSSSTFSFRYGLNTARLKNVCLLNKTTIVYYEALQNGFYGSNQIIDHLEKTYSGFFTSHPESAGWKFISNNSLISADNTSILPEIWFTGETAAMSAPYNNIFHHSQIMLPFIHMISNQNRKEYSWVRSLKRLILSTSSRNDNQWILALTKIIIAALKSLNYGKSIIDLHQQEDISMLTGLNDDKNMLCFESLNIVGTNELSTPFINNEIEKMLFDSHVDDHLGIISLNQRNSKKSKQNEPEIYLNPNSYLNITFLLRSNNRFILNLNDIFIMLNATGLVDPSTIHHRVYYFDGNILSAREQMKIMRETDILISPHGSGLQNMIFMRPQSAVIEIMTSPWYETGYQCTALGMNLNYYVLPQPDINRSYNCAIPRHCFETPLLVQRRSLDCYGIRMCNAKIDVAALEILIWQAAQSVRIKKRALDRWRYSDQDSSDGIGVYQKSYETPLTY